MKNVSDKVVRHSLVYLTVQKRLVTNVLVYMYVKFDRNDPPPSKAPISSQYSLVVPQP